MLRCIQPIVRRWSNDVVLDFRVSCREVDEMDVIRILIADEQPFIRAGIKEVLTQVDTSEELEIIECDPGDHGNEAIGQISAHFPDVIILDIGYPINKGLEVARKYSSTLSRRGKAIWKILSETMLVTERIVSPAKKRPFMFGEAMSISVGTAAQEYLPQLSCRDITLCSTDSRNCGYTLPTASSHLLTASFTTGIGLVRPKCVSGSPPGIYE